MSVNFNHEHVKQHANIDYIRGRVGQSQIKLVTTQTLTGLATWPPVYMKFPATCEGKNYPHKWKKNNVGIQAQPDKASRLHLDFHSSSLL